MGVSYATHTLRGTRASEVLHLLRQRGSSPPELHGYVVVLDAASDLDCTRAFEVARDLSDELTCCALKVLVHHDDVARYELWDAGGRRDSYSSLPDLPEGTLPPEGGNPPELIRLLGSAGSDPDTIERVLRAGRGINGQYLYEHERQAALAAALGLPEHATGFGYRCLARSIAEGQPLSEHFTSTGVAYHDCWLESSSVVLRRRPRK